MASTEEARGAPPAAAWPSLPDLELSRTLGRGLNGWVYLGRQIRLDREVAVKVLENRRAIQGVLAQRLAREARLLAGQAHDCLVPLYTASLDHDPPYLVLEFMAGGDLSRHRRPGDLLPPREVLDVGVRVAAALEFLHRNDVLHRDVKPENIFRNQQGEAFLGDLGLGTSEDAEALTATGVLVGTRDYVAPELLRGPTYSPATDLYALGNTLAELFTGRPARTWDSRNRPARLDRDAIPFPGVAGLILSCLRTDPADRLSDAGQLRRGLEEAARAFDESGERPPRPLSAPALPPGPRDATASRLSFDATESLEAPLEITPSHVEAAPPAVSDAPPRKWWAGPFLVLVAALAGAGAGWLAPGGAEASVPVLAATEIAAPSAAPFLRVAVVGGALRAERATGAVTLAGTPPALAGPEPDEAPPPPPRFTGTLPAGEEWVGASSGPEGHLTLRRVPTGAGSPPQAELLFTRLDPRERRVVWAGPSQARAAGVVSTEAAVAVALASQSSTDLVVVETRGGLVLRRSYPGRRARLVAGDAQRLVLVDDQGQLEVVDAGSGAPEGRLRVARGGGPVAALWEGWLVAVAPGGGLVRVAAPGGALAH